MAAQTPITLEPPGPGPWDYDPVHFPRQMTPYWTQMHPEPFSRGFAEFCSYYGLLIGGRRTAYPNGFSYGQIVPVAEAEIPDRIARAQEVFDRKLWRDQLREWDETCKPAAVATHQEIQAVDPDLLDDAALIDHLGRCRDHHAAMIYQHMRFTGAAMLPIGDLLVHAAQWTGLPPAQLLGMMRDASPISGGSSAQFERLLATVRQDASARDLLESSGDPGKILEELRGRDSDAGRALAAYLDFAGYRLLDGFDISGRYALELPDALLRAIRSSVTGRTLDGSDVEDQIADIRRQVPDQHRGEFNDLLAEARLCYRIRDERGVFSDIWAAGLMRRAALAGGRRLTQRGRIHDAEHFVFAGFDEMTALLGGADTPTADELARRHQFFLTHSATDGPAHLGPPAPPLPDLSTLPPAAARAMAAMGFAMGALVGGSEAQHEDRLIRGLSASGGVYEGPARRVKGPGDFDRIQQGDVLLTESTTEAFNILLPLLGAIVTDAGGLLSHSAIVAREYRIPGVVGTREATSLIPDGARVRVDGDAGEVTVLG